MKLSLTATLSLALGLFAARAEAIPLVEFNFDDNDGIADVVDTDVSAGNFTAGAGLFLANFVDGDATARRFGSADAATALATGDYWSFTVAADAGKQFDLINLTLDEFRGAFGPTYSRFGPVGHCSVVSLSLMSLKTITT